MAASAAALLVTACAPGGALNGRPTASATAASRPPLLAVLDHPFGSVPNTLRLLRADGIEVARAPLPDDAEAVTVAGAVVVVAGGGRIETVSRSGAVDAAGDVPGDGPEEGLVRGLVASPDGSRWLWTTVSQDADGTVHSRIYAAGPGQVAVQVLARDEAGTALQPVAWTAGGPVLADEPVGIGGYVLFRRAFGPTARMDPRTGALTPLADAGCAFNDLGADGTLLCVRDGREGPHGDGPVTLHIARPGAATLDVPLSASVAQAGDALLAPDGRTASLAVSPATGVTPETVSELVVGVADGSLRPMTVGGLLPAAWLPDGRLVATRPDSVAGGAPGVYVVAADGASSVRAGDGTVLVGVVR